MDKKDWRDDVPPRWLGDLGHKDIEALKTRVKEAEHLLQLWMFYRADNGSIEFETRRFLDWPETMLAPARWIGREEALAMYPMDNGKKEP